MTLIIEGKPNTKIRDLCICSLCDSGFAGPPYSLDDISSFCNSIDDESIWVSFYDMGRTIKKDNKYFYSLKRELEIIYALKNPDMRQETQEYLERI